MVCSLCGAAEVWVRGTNETAICFECAEAGEARAARRSVVEHLLKVPGNLRRRAWRHAWYDLTWAWQRLTRTGDYAPDGYFARLYPEEAP